MKEKLLNILKFFVFLSFTIFLFWFVYKDQNFDEVCKSLKNINYFWIFLALIFGILSNLSRAARWNLLIRALNYKPKFLNTFFAVMIMYLGNLAFPRLGEVSRVGILKKYEKIPFRNLLGTVIIERTIDFLMTFLVLLIVLLTQFDVFIKFFKKNPEITKILENFPSITVILFSFFVSIIFLITVFSFFKKYFKETPFYKKTSNFVKQILEGVKTIKNMDNKLLFIGHTFFIWFMYILMLYVTFFCFESMSDLSILVGITVMLMGSFGMIAPVQGGIGAWHFITIETLLIYGIPGQDAKIFALIMHGSMTVMFIVIGFISLISLPIYNKKLKNNIKFKN